MPLASGKRELLWRYDASHASDEARLLANELGISPVIAGLLIKAGLQDGKTAHSFIYPRLAHLQDPFAISNLETAADRILKSVSEGQHIGIVGDYDVDGVTSTVLLVSFLRRFGCYPDYLVPRRMEEGYGLSRAAIERLVGDSPPDLLIALDCGTNSIAEVAHLRNENIDVIIVDHHKSREATPTDCILVNPHVLDPEDSPWSELCTVGLTFKLCHGLTKKLREAGDSVAMSLKLKDSLDLVALGTIADLVPLRDENRIFTSFGLKRLQETPRPGIRALMDVAGLEPEQPLQTTDVSFRLGPRINAGGRMADAALPLEMFLSDEYASCLPMARELDAHNRNRQETERAIFQEALEQAQAEPSEAFGLVVYNADWHAGVLGIVAGRLAREFNRPAIVLGAEGGEAHGSGRSIKGICLQKVLTTCDSLLEEWGGHSMAVGLSLDIDAVGRFRTTFSDAIADVLGRGELPTPEIEIATWLEEEDLGIELLEQLEFMRPFGQGNPEPVFGLREVMLQGPIDTFGKGHLRFSLKGANSQRIQALCWNGAENPMPTGQPIDLAIKVFWNYWQGRRSPRAELVSWRPSS